VCTGETYREVVKLTFARGASLDDPHKLFNSSLEGNTRRAIDIRQGEIIDAKALKTLIQSAIAENLDRGGAKRKPSAKTRRSAKPVKLLSGGNPQITKGDGDAPVQAYIAAMPGWKRDIGKRVDELIVRSVRGVSKAMRWNTPFYGVDGQGFFVGFHCMTKYIKVAFFRGASLRPPPPVKSGQKNVRYFHIHEGEAFDEAQLSEWFKQAADLPGWKLGVS
jgi:hypothetical protein